MVTALPARLLGFGAHYGYRPFVRGTSGLIRRDLGRDLERDLGGDLERPVRYLFIAPRNLLDRNWLIRGGVNFQMKNVEPIVVPDDVVHHLQLDALGNIDVGHDHAFASGNRIGQRLAIWTDDERNRRRRSPEQFLHLGIPLRELLNGIGIERAGGDDIEYLPFERMRRRAQPDGLRQVVVVSATTRA